MHFKENKIEVKNEFVYGNHILVRYRTIYISKNINIYMRLMNTDILFF